MREEDVTEKEQEEWERAYNQHEFFTMKFMVRKIEQERKAKIPRERVLR